ncbi:MAG: MOSC domain-containing protein [Pseudomonadota bacterium]
MIAPTALKAQTASSAWEGRIDGLHIVPRSFLPMRNVPELKLLAGVGVEGDRHVTGEGFHSDRPEEGRQITFFETETLEALKRDHLIDLRADQHRRNVTTRGVPLNHLVGKHFKVGSCVCMGTRLSTPCRHIEQITGLEIFELLLNRAGLNAKIVKGGLIRLGDRIRPA